MPSVREDDRLRVFISYSRRDAAIADALLEALTALGFEAKIDRRDLPFGEKWQSELAEFIRLSDTVIWLVSEASIHSEWVNWELDEVAKRNKRLVPVLIGDTPRDQLPRQLGEIHVLPAEGLFDIRRDLDVLVGVLDADKGWLKEASRLADRAHEWLARGRTSALLLRGIALQAADRWKATRPLKAPAPHQDVLELILASRQAATLRQRWWIGGALAVALGSICLAGYAYLQRGTAIATRDDALLRESKYLADRSDQATGQQEPTIGVLLAIEALPHANSDDPARRDRKKWPVAEVRLETARRAMRELAVIPVPANGALGVSSVAVTPDGKRFLTGGHDHTIRLWDMLGKQELREFRGHASQISSIALTSNGTRAVTGARDNTARVWDLESGRELAVLRNHNHWVDRVIVSSDDKRAVTASWDNTARIWDMESFQEVGVLRGHAAAVLSVAMSRDGSLIFTGSLDRSLRVWDAATAREVQSLQMRAAVSSLGLTADGVHLVAGLGDNSIWVLDAATRTGLAPLVDRVPPPAPPPTGASWRIYRGTDISSIAAIPHSTRIVSASRDGTLRLWDVATRNHIAVLSGHEGHVSGIAPTPDGTRLVTGGEFDSTARIWNLNDGGRLERDIAVPNATSSFAITADGKRLAVGASDGTISLLDLTSGRHLYSRRGHLGVSSLAITPDEKHLVTGGNPDHTLQVWSLETGDRLSQLNSNSPITAVAVTKDNAKAVIGLKNGMGQVWDLDAQRKDFELHGHTGAITSVALTPDGKRIITASEDETARVWDRVTGRHLLTLKGHEGRVTSIAVTPDSTRAITGSGRRDSHIIRPINDYSARVWDLTTGRQLAILNGHTSPITTVAVTPNGERAVTGSQDQTARIWDLANGTENGVIASDGGVGHLVVDNARVLMLSGGVIKSFPLLPFGQALVDTSIQAVPRCMMPHERQHYYLNAAPPPWCLRLSKWPYDRIGALDTSFRLIVNGQESEAEVLLSAVQNYHPDLTQSINRAWAKGYLARATALLSQGKDLQAEQEFARALSRDATIEADIKREWTDAYITRGQTLLDKGEESEANAQFLAAMQRDQSASARIEQVQRQYIERQVSTALDRGRKLLEEGKESEADVQFAAAMQRDQSARARVEHVKREHYVSTALKRSSALLQQASQGRNRDSALAEALAEANAVLRLHNDHPVGLWIRGVIHMSANNIGAALSDLDVAIAKGNRSPFAYFARGVCNQMLGNKSSAIADFQEVLAADELTEEVKLLQAQAQQRLAQLVGGTGPVQQTPQSNPRRKRGRSGRENRLETPSARALQPLSTARRRRRPRSTIIMDTRGMSVIETTV